MQKQLLSVPKAIQTLDEVDLLIQIYSSTEHWKEALDVLDSDNIGLSSPIVENDLFMIRSKLELLEVLRMWDELWEYSRSLLLKALHPTDDAEKGLRGRDHTHRPEYDDWKIWNCLLLANQRINKSECYTNNSSDYCIKR